MIEIDNVSVRFGDSTVLRSLTLTLQEKRIAILGANGSGKSTFIRLLNGLCLPDEGLVRVDGLDTRRNARDVRRLVGFMFQNPDNQIVFPVVHEDVRFGLKNLGVPRQDMDAMVEQALTRFGLWHLRDHQTHTLSGGQKQLLALAGIVAMQPRYLVFDEPTTLLDLRNRNRVVETFAGLEMPTVIVTHDLELAAMSERVIVLDEGRIFFDGAPGEAIARYREKMA